MTEPSDQPIANLTALEKEDNVDEATPENQAVANVTRDSPGLLDLPLEIRLTIFRHLLVFHHGVQYTLSRGV